MNVSLYQAAAAMTANARWQEVISENLASSAAPGFMKNVPSFEAVQAGMLSQPNPDPRMSVTMPRVVVNSYFSQGELLATGNNTDLAIEGNGFFEVQLPDGGTAFTRDGEFRFDSSGQLVTKQGFPVLGENGPVQVDRRSGLPMSVSANGEIKQGQITRGKLNIYEFAKPGSLSHVGGGLYAPSADNEPKPAQKSAVLQGFIESSNVSPVSEMSGLINTMRAFEASQRVLQMHDERMSRVISELGNPN